LRQPVRGGGVAPVVDPRELVDRSEEERDHERLLAQVAVELLAIDVRERRRRAAFELGVQRRLEPAAD
jgi:hypothetical protein